MCHKFTTENLWLKILAPVASLMSLISTLVTASVCSFYWSYVRLTETVLGLHHHRTSLDNVRAFTASFFEFLSIPLCIIRNDYGWGSQEWEGFWHMWRSDFHDFVYPGTDYATKNDVCFNKIGRIETSKLMHRWATYESEAEIFNSCNVLGQGIFPIWEPWTLATNLPIHYIQIFQSYVKNPYCSSQYIDQCPTTNNVQYTAK